MLWKYLNRISDSILVVVSAFLSFLVMTVAILFTYVFAFVYASSFTNIGLRENQQLENTATMATRQLGLSQNSVFSNQNLPDTQDNGNNSNTVSTNLFDFSDLGTEEKNTNKLVNHDVYGTRHTNQTLINKENVASLQVKWRLINDVEIQDPPIILGNTGQANEIVALIMLKQLLLWTK